MEMASGLIYLAAMIGFVFLGIWMTGRRRTPSN